MIGAEHAEIGTSLTVQGPGGDVDAVVVPKPFVDPEKDIPKS